MQRTSWIKLAALLAACGDDAAEEQVPPQGAAALEAWLARGDYQSWACEAQVHEARAPSPHGYNRICSNALISANASGSGSFPRGAAAVKEIYESADASAPSGYAVYAKRADDSADGANWYWYERLPGQASPVADGLGSSGTAKTVCVRCHGAAGSDAAHTPSPGGRDQVYTPVR